MVLLYEVVDNIAILTMNRPEVRNSLNEELIIELINSLKRAGEEKEVRVIVLRSAGDKAFCAGADLGKLGERSSANIIELRSYLGKYAILLRTFVEVGKPIIAAVQGYALAGGCGLAVACDLTVASEKAIFGVPEINIGFWEMMITAPVFRAIGMKKGLELFYTGKQIDAFEAERIGMVNKVVPQDSFENAVMNLAKELASKSPIAMSMGREAFYTTRDMEYGKAVKYLSEMVPILASTDDLREGISAFREKRKPKWKGR